MKLTVTLGVKAATIAIFKKYLFQRRASIQTRRLSSVRLQTNAGLVLAVIVVEKIWAVRWF